MTLARDWCWALYERAVCAHMRGDENLALVSARALVGIERAVDKMAAARGFRQSNYGGRDCPYLTFLADLAAFHADLERRAEEPRVPPATTRFGDSSALKSLTVEQLILNLEHATAMQRSQPGGVNFRDEATVQELVRRGKAAVEPLVECLAGDERLTRSVSFHRDFGRSRKVLPVWDAAYWALRRILETSSFAPGVEYHHDLRDLRSGPQGRKKVADRILAYHQRFYGVGDNDRIYGKRVPDFLKSCAIEEVRIAYRCPWQNPIVERAIGTLRRELLDHVIVLSEGHLRSLLKEFIGEYYHPERPHRSLAGNTPIPRPMPDDRPDTAEIISIPILGGLHHRYRVAV